MNKILFLDIDGVLNTNPNTFHLVKPRKLMVKEFHSAAINNLLSIIRETGCRIVISSSWRLGTDIQGLRKWFGIYGDIASAIVDVTPELEDKQRGEEILTWLRDNAYEGTFAVVDDGNDMDVVRSHFYQTRRDIGLSIEIAMKIKQHLNNPRNEWNHQ